VIEKFRAVCSGLMDDGVGGDANDEGSQGHVRDLHQGRDAIGPAGLCMRRGATLTVKVSIP